MAGGIKTPQKEKADAAAASASATAAAATVAAAAAAAPSALASVASSVASGTDASKWSSDGSDVSELTSLAPSDAPSMETVVGIMGSASASGAGAGASSVGAGSAVGAPRPLSPRVEQQAQEMDAMVQTVQAALAAGGQLSGEARRAMSALLAAHKQATTAVSAWQHYLLVSRSLRRIGRQRGRAVGSGGGGGGSPARSASGRMNGPAWHIQHRTLAFVFQLWSTYAFEQQVSRERLVLVRRVLERSSCHRLLAIAFGALRRNATETDGLQHDLLLRFVHVQRKNAASRMARVVLAGWRGAVRDGRHRRLRILRFVERRGGRVLFNALQAWKHVSGAEAQAAAVATRMQLRVRHVWLERVLFSWQEVAQQRGEQRRQGEGKIFIMRSRLAWRLTRKAFESWNESKQENRARKGIAFLELRRYCARKIEGRWQERRVRVVVVQGRQRRTFEAWRTDHRREMKALRAGRRLQHASTSRAFDGWKEMVQQSKRWRTMVSNVSMRRSWQMVAIAFVEWRYCTQELVTSRVRLAQYTSRRDRRVRRRTFETWQSRHFAIVDLAERTSARRMLIQWTNGIARQRFEEGVLQSCRDFRLRQVLKRWLQWLSFEYARKEKLATLRKLQALREWRHWAVSRRSLRLREEIASRRHARFMVKASWGAWRWWSVRSRKLSVAVRAVHVAYRRQYLQRWVKWTTDKIAEEEATGALQHAALAGAIGRWQNGW